MQTDETRILRINYLANILDGGFYGLSLGLASFSTVVPLFISMMTGSAVLIGLIPAIQNIGWQLPQLLIAGTTSRMTRLKPLVMWITIHERLPYFGLAIIAWFFPVLDHRLALVLTFCMLVWQGFGSGLTANPWLNLIGKIFPGSVLGTFLGFQSSALSLFGSLGSFIAGLILEANSGSQGFAFCFLAAGVSMMIAMFMLNQTVEQNRSETKDSITSLPSIIHNTRKIFREDAGFRFFLIARMASQFCLMAFVFYIVYAVRKLAISDFSAGVLTSIYFFSQVIANPALGFLGDRLNRRLALKIGAICGTLSPLCALLAQNVTWMYAAMALAGIANTAFFTIAMAMSFEYGNEIDRPTYIGMANTLVAPSTIVAPLLGGWLADASGFSATFALAAVAAVITYILLEFFVKNGNADQY